MNIGKSWNMNCVVEAADCFSIDFTRGSTWTNTNAYLVQVHHKATPKHECSVQEAEDPSRC